MRRELRLGIALLLAIAYEVLPRAASSEPTRVHLEEGSVIEGQSAESLAKSVASAVSTVQGNFIRSYEREVAGFEKEIGAPSERETHPEHLTAAGRAVFETSMEWAVSAAKARLESEKMATRSPLAAVVLEEGAKLAKALVVAMVGESERAERAGEALRDVDFFAALRQSTPLMPDPQELEARILTGLRGPEQEAIELRRSLEGALAVLAEIKRLAPVTFNQSVARGIYERWFAFTYTDTGRELGAGRQVGARGGPGRLEIIVRGDELESAWVTGSHADQVGHGLARIVSGLGLDAMELPVYKRVCFPVEEEGFDLDCGLLDAKNAIVHAPQFAYARPWVEEFARIVAVRELFPAAEP
jgi:hypothetical protein